MTSTVHIDNKNKDILIHGERPTKELDDTTLTAKAKYPINFTQSTIIFIIFRDFSMFYQIFLSPQVKRLAIITYKHGIYELPNDLRLRILGN